MNKSKWLTVKDVIEKYQISQSTVRRIIKEIEEKGISDKYLLKEPYKHTHKYYVHIDYLEKRFEETSHYNADEVIKVLHQRIQSLENQLEIANNRDKEQRDIIKEATSTRKQLQDLLQLMATKKIKLE